MMANADKVDRMKRDVLSNLSKDKLKRYIFHLARKYFETYMKGNEEAFNESIESMMELYEMYGDIYRNFMGFLYYALYINSVLIISEKSGNDEFSLKNIHKYDLTEDDGDGEELHHDLKKIFNKERVRERYDEKRND